jgi:hypothetical protein
MTKRTTINLPDELWKAAKMQALQVGKDFQDLVADRLRQGLGEGYGPRPDPYSSLAKALEHVAGPALVSEETMRRLIEGDEAQQSLRRMLDRFVDEASKPGPYDAMIRVMKERTDQMMKELERGAERFSLMNSYLKALANLNAGEPRGSAVAAAEKKPTKAATKKGGAAGR